MTIGLFAPLPLALMIPFMATQSLAMGEAFGLGFQYGKRRVSAMSNEEFNKLTPEALHKSMQAGVKGMIPEMKQSMSNFTMLQVDIIKELINYIKVILAEAPQIVSDFASGSTGTDLGKLGGELLFSLLKQGGLGNVLPSAEARRGDTQTTGDQDILANLTKLFGKTPDPKIGGTSAALKANIATIQKFQEQRARSEAFDAAKVSQTKQDTDLIRQATVARNVGLVKPLAGRSQRAERDRLARAMNSVSLRRSQIAKHDRRGVFKKQAFDRELKTMQASMVRLLSRYRW